MKQPYTTLFMISSVDGKISSGDTDAFDVDQDWKRIRGVKEGLPQYYALEKTTDYHSLITGRVLAKIGINTRSAPREKVPVRFVVIDNRPHLTERGVQYMADWAHHVYVVTTNKNHPAYEVMKRRENITMLYKPERIDFKKLFNELREAHGVKRLTIQSGGELNAVLLRAGLIDRLSLVVAPVLVGGRATPTLIDGEAVHSVEELGKLRPLSLISVKKLKHSYLHLVYRVKN